MNCTHVRQVLDAYIDGELDSATSTQITQHLAGCPSCTAGEVERGALRALVRSHAPRHAAPAQLRARIEAFEGGEPRHVYVAAPQGTLGKRPSWFAAGALASLAAVAGLMVGLWLARPAPDDALHEQVAASHVASLADMRRLMDVAASDQHVVKPWLQGKIDFAPRVQDFAAEGFTLAGARLDHVAERQAAAIVYRIRKHVINVFVWRTGTGASEAQVFATARGYGIVTWATGGLRYAAISDVDAGDLKRLAALLARAP